MFNHSPVNTCGEKLGVGTRKAGNKNGLQRLDDCLNTWAEAVFKDPFVGGCTSQYAEYYNSDPCTRQMFVRAACVSFLAWQKLGSNPVNHQTKDGQKIQHQDKIHKIHSFPNKTPNFFCTNRTTKDRDRYHDRDHRDDRDRYHDRDDDRDRDRRREDRYDDRDEDFHRGGTGAQFQVLNLVSTG